MNVSDSDLQLLDEAFDRLHATGPEFEEWLSNHGPMAVEALVRHGRPELVHSWIDEYRTQLEDFPAPYEAVTAENWKHALGDPRRLGDWPAWFREQLAEAEWTEVLAQWWPRLLPGAAASATHCVIRVGHAVRTLRQDGVNEIRLEELSQALAYWAARWQPLADPEAPAGGLAPTAALAKVPRVPDQDGGIRQRLAQLDDLSAWAASRNALAADLDPQTASDQLHELVSASLRNFRTYSHGNPVMLVHAVTAPNAVLRTLPSLPREQWAESLKAAWIAAAATTAAYAPPTGRTAPEPPPAADGGGFEGVFAAAADGADAHAIKFADTALDVHRWSGSDEPLETAAICTELIRRLG